MDKGRFARWSRFRSNRTENRPPLTLPMLFFETGLVALGLAPLDLAAHLGDFLAGRRLSPGLLPVAHLYVLAGITSIMIGALYQFIPVALDARGFKARWGWAHWPAHLLGVAGLVIGLGGFIPGLVVGGALLFISFALFFYYLFDTLRGARQWYLPAFFIVSGLVYLGATVALGLGMVWGWWQGGIPVGRLLGMHITLGLGGWIATTLFGVSYRLFPMFAPAAGKVRHGWWVWGCWQVAVIGSIMGWSFSDALWWVVAGGGAVVGLCLYYWDMLDMWMERRRFHRDPASWLVMAAWPSLVGGLAWGVWAVWRHDASAITGAAYVVLAGWAGASIFGYLQKIYPFMVWLERYGHGGMRPTPRLEDIWPRRRGLFIAGAYLAGMALVLTARWGPAPEVAWIGLALQSSAAWLMAVYIVLARIRPARRVG